MSSIITYTHTHSTHTHSIFKIENQQTSCAPHIHLHQHTHTYIHTLYTSHTHKETYNKYLNISFFLFPVSFLQWKSTTNTPTYTPTLRPPHMSIVNAIRHTHTHPHTTHLSVYTYYTYAQIHWKPWSSNTMTGLISWRTRNMILSMLLSARMLRYTHKTINLSIYPVYYYNPSYLSQYKFHIYYIYISKSKRLSNF